jgi:excisionase family DNA binding protein
MTGHDTNDHTASAKPEPPLLLTAAQAAALLSISRTTLYELLASGAVESIHIGRSRRVPVSALHTFVESRRRAGHAQ